MDQERTRITRPRAGAETDPVDEGSPSPLLEASRGWAGAAREAHESMTKGAEAVRHVQLRHNTSGQ